MFKIPSFSEWMSRKSLMEQFNINIFLKMFPLFIVIFGSSICRSMGYSQELSWTIAIIAGVLFFLGYMNWDYGNRNATTAYLPLNMTLVWNSSRVDEVITTIVDYVPLKEDIPNNKYIYMVKFDLPQKDDKNAEYQHALFINNHPIDKTFRRVPGQFIAYRGSIFEGLAARVVATYCNEFDDITGIDQDMGMGQFKVFHTKWCLEDSKADQVGLGLYKETANGEIDKGTITEAAQLEIDRKAARLGMINREVNGQLTLFSEAYEDTVTRSYRGMNKLIDNVDRIRQERQGTVTRMLRDPKVRIIVGLILAVALVYTLRFYKVI